ncbi:TetR family transcriptional regulator [Streptomyces sp. NPDC048290]|uniref:TetR/AcrR family transcriptional regulator n=1 Tax=Streptomyces sp. NPDC048290 TaxID=3155811 RepID=UPI00343C26DC
MPVPSGSLTERRKAATRMEIARAAAGLFVSRGLRATRAEDIAQAAGIAPRTFYRYFATKEEAVAPLYATGAQRWAQAVRDAPAGLTVPEALEYAVRHTFTPGAGVSSAAWEWVRTLVRLAEASPSLGRVWAEVGRTSERELARVLAERTRSVGGGDNVAGAGGPATGLRADLPRVAPPAAVLATSPAASPAGSPATSPAGSPATSPAAPAEPAPDTAPPPPPALRFAAAVASAAVRVAVESWAAGDAPAGGAGGPAALAVRNLAALREFPWERV